MRTLFPPGVRPGPNHKQVQALMAGNIAENTVREVLERTSLVRVIGEFVGLKKAGHRHKGLCPFHNEKTPSFTVNEERGFFYCFGCGEKGDAISFLRQHNGMSFVEAVEQLAGQAGVLIEQDTSGGYSPARRQAERSERASLLDVTQQAGEWFVNNLAQAPSDSPVARYLVERGLEPETCSRFQLGLAPDGWDHLARWMMQHGVDLAVAEKLGLIAPRGSGGGYYDRFRNRLIFPIFDLSERMIGFGGRILPGGDDKAAKYVNSPDNPLYTKGDVLFGLAQAKRKIRSEGRSVLVEGNVDVLMLHQCGFDHTVAPMGTALTKQQVQLAMRFSDEIVLLYDGDSAGRAAASKSLEMMLECGAFGRVAVLPLGQDPDSFVREHGTDALKLLLERARPLTEYLIDETVEHNGLSDHGRAQSLQALAPVVSAIQDKREQDLTVARLATALQLPEPKVVGMLRDSKRIREEPGTKREQDQGAELPRMEREVVETCLTFPDGCLPFVEEQGVEELLSHESLRAVLWEAITLYGEDGRLDNATLLTRLEQSPLSSWTAEVLSTNRPVTEEHALEYVMDHVTQLRLRQTRGQLQQLQAAMERAQRDGDQERVEDFLRQKMALSMQVKESAQLSQNRAASK